MQKFTLLIAFLISLSFLDKPFTSPTGRTPSSLPEIQKEEDYLEGRRILSLLRKLGIPSTAYQNTKEVVVAVLDTGVNLNDSWIMSKVYEKKGVKQIVDLSGVTKDGNDNHGHGTEMISIILTINPNARILPIKCFDLRDSDKKSFLRSYRKALSVIRKRYPEVSVINISGGGEGSDIGEETLIYELANKGKVIVAAAGNQGEDLSQSNFYPASYRNHENLISVAGLSYSGELAKFSNYGDKVIDFAVPGEGIQTYDREGNLTTGSGTSHSTAIISGIAALLIGHKVGNNINLKETLRLSSKGLKGTVFGQVDIPSVLATAITDKRNQRNEIALSR